MELPKRGDRSFRTKAGKRLRTPEEFIKMTEDKGHPISKVMLYNAKENIVIEALKDMKTKHTHILKARRPTNVEEKEWGGMMRKEALLTGKRQQDQLEIIVGGDDFKKKPLKSK